MNYLNIISPILFAILAVCPAFAETHTFGELYILRRGTNVQKIIFKSIRN